MIATETLLKPGSSSMSSMSVQTASGVSTTSNSTGSGTPVEFIPKEQKRERNGCFGFCKSSPEDIYMSRMHSIKNSLSKIRSYRCSLMKHYDNILSCLNWPMHPQNKHEMAKDYGVLSGTLWTLTYAIVSNAELLTFDDSKFKPNLNIVFGEIVQMIEDVYDQTIPFRESLEKLQEAGCIMSEINNILKYLRPGNRLSSVKNSTISRGALKRKISFESMEIMNITKLLKDEATEENIKMTPILKIKRQLRSFDEGPVEPRIILDYNNGQPFPTPRHLYCRTGWNNRWHDFKATTSLGKRAKVDILFIGFELVANELKDIKTGIMVATNSLLQGTGDHCFRPTFLHRMKYIRQILHGLEDDTEIMHKHFHTVEYTFKLLDYEVNCILETGWMIISMITEIKFVAALCQVYMSDYLVPDKSQLKRYDLTDQRDRTNMPFLREDFFHTSYVEVLDLVPILIANVAEFTFVKPQIRTSFGRSGTPVSQEFRTSIGPSPTDAYQKHLQKKLFKHIIS